MRGKKGVAHLDPEDPPRRRANKRPGHGTWETDRPPVCGVVGRESGEIRLTVTERSDGETLDTVVRRTSWPMVKVNTDEWCGYNGLPEMGRSRVTVCHAEREWARDDDGDGIREVHNNTLEGLWTGLRNFLRPFRGVNKVYLYQYVAMFEWGYNVKRVTDGVRVGTPGCPVCHHLPCMSHFKKVCHSRSIPGKSQCEKWVGRPQTHTGRVNAFGQTMPRPVGAVGKKTALSGRSLVAISPVTERSSARRSSRRSLGHRAAPPRATGAEVEAGPGASGPGRLKSVAASAHI